MPAKVVAAARVPATPIGEVGLADAPGPAGGVGDDRRRRCGRSRRTPARAERAPRRRGPPAAARRVRPSTLDASTPAAAITSPRRFSTIEVVPAAGDHSHRLVADRAAPDRPSAPAPRTCSPPCWSPARRPRRTGPGRTSEARGRCPGRPRRCRSTAQARRLGHRTRSSAASDHVGGGVVVGHPERYGATANARGLDPGDGRRVDVSTSQPSSTPPADRAP